MRESDTQHIHQVRNITLGIVALALITIAVGFVYSQSAWPIIWNSPDEAASAQVLTAWSYGPIAPLTQPLNDVAQNQIHPRSFNVRADGTLVPGGFIGLSLWLRSFWMFSPWLVDGIFLCLIIFALAACYALISRIADRATGYIALLLIVLHPYVIYWALKPLYNNLWLCLGCVLGIWLIIAARDARSRMLTIAAGIVVGWTLTFRFVEVLWYAPLLIFIVYALHKSFRERVMMALLICCGVFVGMLPTLIANSILYGHWWLMGYQALTTSTIAQGVPVAAYYRLVYPIATAHTDVLGMVWGYLVVLNWPWALLLCMGLAALLISGKFNNPSWRRVSSATLFISFVLILIYGRYVLNDSLDATQLSIANSYTRYWLPIIFSTVPIAAYGMRALLTCTCRVIVLTVLVLVLGWTSIPLIFTGADGFIQSLARQNEFQLLRETIVRSTPENAVILTDRADKFIYPSRSVIERTGWDRGKAIVAIDALLSNNILVYELTQRERDIVVKDLGPTLVVEQTTVLIKNWKLYAIIRAPTTETNGEPTKSLMRTQQVSAASMSRDVDQVMPKVVSLDVPFIVQAPLGVWSQEYEEACEEASVLMAAEYAHAIPAMTTPQAQAQALTSLIAYEKLHHGAWQSTPLELVATLARERFGLNASIDNDVTLTHIHDLLLQGRLIIVPVAGREIGNPYFKKPGPLYHMLIVKGVVGDSIITNDPGTKHGDGLRYSWSTFSDAIHDWNDGDVYNGARMMLVIAPAETETQ